LLLGGGEDGPQKYMKGKNPSDTVNMTPTALKGCFFFSLEPEGSVDFADLDAGRQHRLWFSIFIRVFLLYFTLPVDAHRRDAMIDYERGIYEFIDLTSFLFKTLLIRMEGIWDNIFLLVHFLTFLFLHLFRFVL
jgi:hypothetical protein